MGTVAASGVLETPAGRDVAAARVGSEPDIETTLVQTAGIVVDKRRTVNANWFSS